MWMPTVRNALYIALACVTIPGEASTIMRASHARNGLMTGQEKREATEMAFEAKYRGHCANECGTAIEPGDSIVYNDDLEVEHAGCVTKVERPRVVCDKCWIVKPCWCDNES